LKKYILDTNICIYLSKGLFDLSAKIEDVGIDNCFISEITVAELKYGAANSNFPEKNIDKVNLIQQIFTIVYIFNSLDIYAREKARLRKVGNILDDFDLLIGATAISNNLTLVTRNISDFNRINGLEIENWI